MRGAPLIGVAAAYGLALAGLSTEEQDPRRFRERLGEAADELATTRPTAVNLTWAIKRLLRVVGGAASIEKMRQSLVDGAQQIHQEDIAGNQRIGVYGAELLRESATILTHCNAGSLATGGYGTALAVVRAAFESKALRHVFATETRPLMQGARLTAWELARDGIPFTIIVDGAAGSILHRGLVDAVVVGADRIAANGDVANKIGTYQLAVLARENGVPFYVAAPTSTIDLSLPSGDAIPIEERSQSEITSLGGVNVMPNGGSTMNPAFDVTPNAYVSAIVTENGVAKPPYGVSLGRFWAQEANVSG